MKKLIVSVFVMLSLLVGPLAHAAGMDCPEAGCAFETVKEKKHNESKVAEAGHHCCCAPMLDNFGTKPTEPFHVAASTFNLPEMEHLASVTVGPLLEPPSHA